MGINVTDKEYLADLLDTRKTLFAMLNKADVDIKIKTRKLIKYCHEFSDKLIDKVGLEDYSNVHFETKDLIDLSVVALALSFEVAIKKSLFKQIKDNDDEIDNIRSKIGEDNGTNEETN